MTNELKPFLSHLEELRRTLLKCLAFWLVAGIFIWPVMHSIIPILVKPAGSLIFTSPAEALNIYLMLTMVGAGITASPFILYQLWQFAAAAIDERRRRNIFWYIIFSLVLFLTGAVSGCMAVFPWFLNFLLSFKSFWMRPLLSVSEYFRFMAVITIITGFIFEIPLILFFLISKKLVNGNMLWSRWREAVTAIFIIAAVFTPPDAVSQCLLAGPLLGLYFGGLLICKIFIKR